MGVRTLAWPAALVGAALALGACTGGSASPAQVMKPGDERAMAGAETPADAASPSVPMHSVTATMAPPPVFDPAAAFETVEYLAGNVGPREATSAAFHEAAEWVEQRFADLGYVVTQEDVPVPAGDPSYRPEWGTVVEPGTSANVIADPADFDPTEPHVIIGAHLDTVAVSPGAEDNASGVAAAIELARLAAEHSAQLPVRFIAFGAEEPRGPGDDMHHFGSQQYVRELPVASAVVAMVSLDRVGVRSADVPVCTGGTGTTAVMDALLAAADDAGIGAQRCENRASDHWSFEKAAIPAARLGSVPYAGYHSPNDVPDVVDPDQLDRVGTIVWTWLLGLSR
jgi:hypothetical protein